MQRSGVHQQQEWLRKRQLPSRRGQLCFEEWMYQCCKTKARIQRYIRTNEPPRRVNERRIKRPQNKVLSIHQKLQLQVYALSSLWWSKFSSGLSSSLCSSFTCIHDALSPISRHTNLQHSRIHLVIEHDEREREATDMSEINNELLHV